MQNKKMAQATLPFQAEIPIDINMQNVQKALIGSGILFLFFMNLIKTFINNEMIAGFI